MSRGPLLGEVEPLRYQSHLNFLVTGPKWLVPSQLMAEWADRPFTHKPNPPTCLESGKVTS